MLLPAVLGLGWVLGGPVRAATGELGVGLDFVRDLPDPLVAEGGATFLGGGALRVPARLRFADSVAARATLMGGALSGQDRVEWNGATSRVYSDEHGSLLSAVHLLLGPEISLPNLPLQPFIGVEAGPALVQTWHSFGGVTAELVEPARSDAEDAGAVDPYTTQWVAAAGLHVGGRLPLELPFALEVEAGYTVSFIPEATLRKSLPELAAVRSPFGLNPLRLGVAATFPLGRAP